MSGSFEETWKKEIDRFMDQGCPFIAAPGQVYIQGPNEAAPKRRYLNMSTMVQTLIVKYLKLLGIPQHIFFQQVMLDLAKAYDEARRRQGWEPMEVPWEELIKADDILWAKHGFEGRRKAGTRIVVHECDGVPLSFKTEEFRKYRDSKDAGPNAEKNNL